MHKICKFQILQKFPLDFFYTLFIQYLYNGGHFVFVHFLPLTLITTPFLGSWQKPTAGLGGAAAIEPRPQHNFSTVAVVPVSDDVPLTAFTYELYHSLSAIGMYIIIYTTVS